MNKQIEIVRNARKYLLGMVADLTVDEFNEIPKGFNNNIIWNLAHLISTQQSACYIRAGLNLVVEERYFTQYKPDTKPTGPLDATEIDTIRKLLMSTLDQFAKDYDKNLFINYKPWTNRYDVAINNIEEMLGFLPFHEGLHLGYTMALKRVIKSA
jgi:hypothetical protein